MSADTERWAEDHWDYVEQAGAIDYEDEDQRLGGNDNPHEED